MSNNMYICVYVMNFVQYSNKSSHVYYILNYTYAICKNNLYTSQHMENEF